MAYTPSQHTSLNKPIAVTGDKPDSAKVALYDGSKFIYRAFLSVEEVNDYIPIANRNPFFTPVINNTGVLNETTGKIEGGLNVEYWYQDGVNLVIKTPDLSPYALSVDLQNAINTLNALQNTVSTNLTTFDNYVSSLYQTNILTEISEGGSYTIPDGTALFLLNPPIDTTLINYTLQLPLNIGDNKELILVFGEDAPDLQNIIVNKLTIDGNGRTIKFGINPSVIRSGDTIVLHLVNNVWREI